MAKKKAELKASYITHLNLCRLAGQCYAERDFRSALNSALESLNTLCDALVFHRRFAKSAHPPVDAPRFVLSLAPPLFAYRAIDAIEDGWNGWKKSDRAEFPDLPTRLQRARLKTAFAADVWSYLARPNGARVEKFVGNHAALKLIRFWTNAGMLVTRSSPTEPSRYHFVSDLRREVWCKCSGCGVRRREIAADLLSSIRCPHCGQTVSHVIVQRVV